MSGHERIDRRSLELHRAIAAKLREHLDRWSAQPTHSQPYWDAWREILSQPLDRVLALPIEDSERMTALRQATPFAGVLEQAERWAFYPNLPSHSPKHQPFNHVLEVAAAIARQRDFIVCSPPPKLPVELLLSSESAQLIDGSIGEGSPFEKTLGYYAHGIDETTAVLPDGWRDRLVLVTGENTRFIRGWCLDPHDLAISKW